MSEETYGTVIGPDAREKLRKLGEVQVELRANELTEAQYASLWKGADYVLTGWGVRPPKAEWFENPIRVRAVCHAAGSVRMIPREVIERGVIVTSARAAIARTVAEFSLTCVLSLLRHLPVYDAKTADAMLGLGCDRRPRTRTLFGKTVALIGLGHVGRQFREMLRPFGARVLAVDPALQDEAAKQLEVEKVTLQEALAQADVVSLHAPDIPATRGMIGPGELSLLRDGAVLVNTARGRLIETDALTECCASGRIYAALDVTDPEPLPTNHPLRGMPNVLVTPHVAGPTTDELPRLGDMAVTDLERVVSGWCPLYPIDLAGYDAMSF